MLKAVILFIVGLLCLIFGGDWFVDGSTGIAKKFHIPEILIGATIVSIGTTLPEVMVSATGALQGHSQIAYGNAIGSCICNVALIAAITLSVAPSNSVDTKALRIPAVFFFAAALIYAIVSYTTGYFSRMLGIVLLCIFAIYISLQIKDALSIKKSDSDFANEGDEEEKPLGRNIISLVVGAVLIAAGANLLVDNGTIIAQGLGVPESVIALTFVALGTSLPEFVTAITSLIKGHGLLSLGNIIGANLFNLVLVSGLSIALSPFNVPADKLIFGMNAALVVDIPLMLTVMLIMLLPAFIKKRLYRWQGIVLLCLYAAYTVFQFAF